MIKALVTGGNGQLAQSLKDVVNHQDELDVDFQDLPDLDITNKQQLESYFSNNELDYCINCAAYTAVDLAEEQSDLAYAVNAEGPKYLAEVCQKHQVTLIHISTDFVFDGQKRIPYLETDAPNPLSVYGASKLQGERSIQETTEAYFIVRTSWLYSEYGNNFIKTMLRLSETRDEISVVSDQIGSPTYAGDLAEVLIKIVLSSSISYGIYHYSNGGIVSWYDFASEIFKQFGKKIEVKPIKTKDYPTAAKRPKYSVLDTTKIKNNFDCTIKDWQGSLNKVIYINEPN
ncbi:dTDP-4-dehydrorhamnose reductase [Formosa sp. Hel3_A1_48]|jgi:dTDP-4-dehydrorhamnose reductase|uniref:dTDP-4-dehydrorhamnose reductase n=1 Tax=Formosa sp. Hel3_A1_48 TaxID=1336795 RepID=UPI00084E2AB7|nr:dTDP-4-dehydrorhamnose reductase [Formosa sp. Hel3_A1_48]AOR26374.1 dTDP-4-dehydrorhamnose reductase [Formosa sp. Hel3_A1_48]MDC0950070.1 dTDP-4-dehydrorhamnose reductase [Flavobacteriaceae bacterium]